MCTNRPGFGPVYSFSRRKTVPDRGTDRSGSCSECGRLGRFTVRGSEDSEGEAEFLEITIRRMKIGRILLTSIALLMFHSGARADVLTWQTAEGYRYASVRPGGPGRTGFDLLRPEVTGIHFTNHLTDEAIAKNRILENGSGLALGDVDGDGWCDIYFCRLQGPNVLYRNLGGWRFEDVTPTAGVACADQSSTGALLSDVDGDGDLDLLVNSIGGGTRLFLNDGSARFTESREAGFARRFGAMSMSMADIDGDGDLELYVTNYRTTTVKDGEPGLKVESRLVDGRIVLSPEDRFAAVTTKSGSIRVRELGEPDILYVNKGGGRFGPISWIGGAFVDADGNRLDDAPRDWGLVAMFRDMNHDGTPDLYVCNDFFYSFDRIWMNQAGRRFQAISRTALRKISMSSMTVDFADIDRDGDDDFFVADMLSRDHRARHRQRANTAMMADVNSPIRDPEYCPEIIQNTLQLNRGDGTYAEIANIAGVEASEWTWSAVFVDVDLDGYEDLLVTNGHAHDVLDADMLRETAQPGKSAEQHLKDLKKFPRLELPNLAFRNRRDRTFEEVGAEWGFNTARISHGMALGDLDNDGDLDVVINNLNSAAGVYRNQSETPRVAVRLRGNAPNTRGIGAKIKVSGGLVTQTQEMISGGRYLSGDDAVRVFAAGTATNRLTIEVVWRNGKRSVVAVAQPNHVYEIAETSAVENSGTRSDSSGGAWFSDVSAMLGHSHRDDAYDDSQRQPLMPYKLSQAGPGLSWFDMNHDGWEELLISSGQGGRLAIYENDRKGGFSRLAHRLLDQPVLRDQTGVVAFKMPNGQVSLLVGSANYEDDQPEGAAVRQVAFDPGGGEGSLTGLRGSTGPLALADLDADGDLDLFVGARVVRGRWPEPADSGIWRWQENQWLPDSANNRVLQKIGLVSGAVWADLDADGMPELILACEWGPIRVFRNRSGQLQDATAQWGLDQFTGWWNGITVGDIDGDGTADLIASNWGLNSFYRASADRPARLYYGDFQGRDAFDVVETEIDGRTGGMVPRRPLDVLGAAIPALRDRFSTHRAFGEAVISDVLKPYLRIANEVQATTLSSMLFLNRAGRFVPVELPFDAQLSTAFGVNVADFDGDGDDDVFLAQNFFATQIELPRQDAGRGLWLRNDGTGKLDAMSGQDSGIQIYGEQRAAAVCDFNHDGRIDLAVGQNHSATKLYLNQRAKRGLRVVLKGGPGNPGGVGAQMRVVYADNQRGPLRTVHAGAGYLAQDSPVQVLGLRESPVGLWIRWPGGREQTMPVNEGQWEIDVTQ